MTLRALTHFTSVLLAAGLVARDAPGEQDNTNTDANHEPTDAKDTAPQTAA